MIKLKFGKPLCRSIIAVAMMMLSLQAMAYDFSYTHQGKTLYYNITSENTVAVTYYTNNYNNYNYVSGDVVIPSTLTYNGTTYSVTSIGGSAFGDCSGLTSVTIPNSVTSIGGFAFSGCSDLTSVTIPNSVTSIGDFAFLSCSGLTSINVASGNTHYSSIDGVLYNYVQDTLIKCPGAKTSVTIPIGVTFIGEQAFRGCRGLTSVTIPNSVTSIGEVAFSGCSGLTSVTIGNSVTSIGDYVFSGCSGLTSVTIGNSVTSIGDGAFYYCSSLTSINVASGNTHYSSIDGVLYNYVQDTLMQCPCAKTSITIPNSVTSIGEHAFENCSGLTSVTIGNSVTSIGDYVFSGCSGLTSVTIGNSVTSIGDGAFYYCSSLTSINVASGNTHYSSIDGVLYNYVQDTLMQCPCAKTSITIANSVTSIGEAAFENCSGLTSVTIPNSVTSIGGSAFWCCRGLTSVTIGNSVTSIGEAAFYNCSGLTSVTIGNSVTSIGGGAFEDCSGLTSVTIPNSVTSIGVMAFYDCSGLTTLNFNAINCQDFEAYYDNNGNRYYPFSGTSLTTVNIGDSVQRIPANFVRNCSGLTSVTIPNSVTSIGEWAFYNCSGLTTLNFNAINCQDFEAYYNDYPFSGTSLTTVNIGDSVQRIPANFVRGCSSLTSVTIGNSVTSIGDSAFNGCSGLVSVVIGDGITNIGRNLFGDCPYLTYLTIGRSVESIENGAFLNCSLLSQITSWASVPPEIGGIDAFPHPNNCTVTVPCGSLGAYTEQTNRWNLLFNGRISEGLSFGLSVSANDEAYGRVEVENHSCESKTLTAIANEGYEFTGWNDGNTENPRTVTITSDTAFMAIFSPASSLQEVNAREFALYPNPAKSFVTLEFETLEENTLLQILDLNGRRVRTLELKAGVETLQIDVSDLPKGVYTIMLGNTTKKLIVE